MRFVVALALAVTALPLFAGFAEAQDFPIVYVRCARTDVTVDLTGEVVIGGVSETRTRTMRGADLYDALPDVSHFFGGFSGPCDLVYREPSGEERVLYDCSSESTAASACAAIDPAVSFDGRTVAFTVFYGTLEGSYTRYDAKILDPDAENDDYWSTTLPTQILHTVGAQLHLVDVATGEVTAFGYVEGIWDAGPAWLSNGRLAFTSNRSEVMSTLVFGRNNTDRVSQIFTMDLDGRNVDLASHHALAGEQHPLQLRDGRVAYASWQLFGAIPFRKTNGSPGGFGTLRNMFSIFAQNPDGSHNFALYGQHIGNGPSGLGLPDHKAAHFLGQSSDGRIWTTDYYRANNNGLGKVLGFMPEPDGLEGYHPEEVDGNDMYRPRDLIDLAPWSSSGDQMSGPMAEPQVMHPDYADPMAFDGKVGHATGVPDNQLLVTWGKGACSTVGSNSVFEGDAPPFTSGSGQGRPLNVITELGRDGPGCDAGVYLTTRIPSEHPSDLERIVDHREWHEFMARPVVPYAEIHGVEAPADVPRPEERAGGDPWLEHGTPFGVLGAASMLLRETAPEGGIRFHGEKQWGLQGTDTIDYTDEELCGLRILGVLPNTDSEYGEMFTAAGERVVILGEIPVRNFRDGSPVMDERGMPDTSFRVRFPANTPYLMQGIDCRGRTLNTDQTWQHLRPGEEKTCGGCHVHSEPALDFETTFAAEDGYAVTTMGEGIVQLLEGGEGTEVRTREVEGYGMQVQLERDVMPIFERRCVSCHGGGDAAAGLQLDLPLETEECSTWYRLVRDRGQQCVPEELRYHGSHDTRLRRPQLTKYVRFMNSRGSLLYWKAANERTDNRTDDMYGPDDGDWHDVDFGVDHPTDITEEELGILARWIDTGASAGADYLTDTLPPTLNLVADVEDGAVATLRVGTADIPSGVDVGSLEVCLLDDAGECGDDLAGDAEPHGVTVVTMPAALEDPDRVVRATVRDVAGNETVVERTVGYLLDAPPPVPPSHDLPDGGMGPGGPDDPGAGPGDETMTGGCACDVGPEGRGLPGLALAAAVAFALLLRRRRAGRHGRR